MAAAWGHGDASLWAPAWRRLVLRGFYQKSMAAWRKFFQVAADPGGRQLRKMERRRKEQEKVLLDLTRQEEEMRQTLQREAPNSEAFPLALPVGQGAYLKPYLPPTATCEHEETYSGTNASKSYTECRNPECKRKVTMQKVLKTDMALYVKDCVKNNPAARKFYTERGLGKDVSKGSTTKHSTATSSSSRAAGSSARSWTVLSTGGGETPLDPQAGRNKRSAEATVDGNDSDGMSTTSGAGPRHHDVEAAQAAAQEMMPREPGEAAPMCQSCQVPMVVRRNRFGSQELFWGCPNYPAARGRCRYTLPFETARGQEPPVPQPVPTTVPMSRAPPGALPPQPSTSHRGPPAAPSQAPTSTTSGWTASSQQRPELYQMSENAPSHIEVESSDSD